MGKDAYKYTGDATLLRKVNESAVLELIRDKGPISRSELARLLHLSPPTITRIVNPLVVAGYVLEGELGHSRGGRPPTMLELNHRANLIIGVYMHQSMVGALSDLGGEILERHSLPARPGEEGLQQLITLIEYLLQAAEQYGIPVRGVGIGAPSITLSREGVVTWAPVYGWRDLPLKARLQEVFDLPIFVENEVNLIALGERWRGAGRGVRNLVCISIGAGIGAGIILNGRLHRGTHDAAGEIGYIIPNERCLDGQYDSFGCLEGLAGTTGIMAKARERMADAEFESGLLVQGPDGITAEAVLSAARNGDPFAKSIVQETIDYLSIAIANLSCVLDPERIILGGDLVDYSDLFIEPISKRLQGLVPVVPEITRSALGLDAPILGAVAMVMQQTDDWLFIEANA